MGEMEALLYTQSLVDNDNSVRMRALTKLRNFLVEKSRNKGFTRSELIKIWKGLYYCFYNTDKPLIQENIAEEISCLIHLLETNEQKRLFFHVAIETYVREWSGIDNFRLNKYFMLFTRVLRQCLYYLLRTGWSETEVKSVSCALEETIVCPFDLTHSVPLGIKLHLVDVILEELAKVGKEDLSTNVISIFILPFIKVLAVSKDKTYVNAVKNRLLNTLIKQTDAGIERNEDLAINEVETEETNLKEVNQRNGIDEDLSDEDEDFAMDPRAGGVDVYLPQLRPDFTFLAEVIKSVGSMKEVSAKKRKLLYSYVRKFMDLSKGTYPFVDPSLSTSGVPKVKNMARKEVSEAVTITKKRKLEADADDELEEEPEPSESMIINEELKASRKMKRKMKQKKEKMNKLKDKSKEKTKKQIKEYTNQRKILSEKLSNFYLSTFTAGNEHVSLNNSHPTISIPNESNDWAVHSKKSLHSSNSKSPEISIKGDNTPVIKDGFIISPHKKDNKERQDDSAAKIHKMILKEDGWSVIKLVPKSTESNKILQGRTKKVKRLQKQQQKREKNQQRASPINKKIKGTKTSLDEKKESVILNIDSANNAKEKSKKKKKNQTINNGKSNNKKKNKSPEKQKPIKNNNDNAIGDSSNKIARNSPDLKNNSNKPEKSISNKKKHSPTVKNNLMEQRQDSSQGGVLHLNGKSKEDPWLEPLQEGEVEIVIPSKKWSKKPKDNSNMVIAKTPKRNTRGRTLRISLEKNQEHDLQHYQRVLRSNPELPLSVHKKPFASILKPSPSPIPIRKSLKKTSKIKSMQKKFNL